MSITQAALARVFEQHRKRYLAEWFEFLRFPTIGTDPARARDCVACAQWLARGLRRSGFEARLLETRTKPVVFGVRHGSASRPTVLFYGHYDVQPVDPLESWTSPPFEPALRGGRVYGRGANDNKGQTLYALKAIEALVAAAPEELGTVKIILEGEEESGSHAMQAGLARWRRLLKADVLMACDTGTVASGAPTVIMGLRGIAHLTVTLRGARQDLHSGVHGGLAPNPAIGMAHLLATLHAPDGRVAVPGFYKGVRAATALEQRLARSAPFDAALYRRQTGTSATGGEVGRSPEERVGFRPCLEINGLHSGYGGPGMKTIIPAEAMAKLSVRLVAGQDPAACLRNLCQHLKRHVPRGLVLELSEASVGGPALRVNPRSALVGQARDVLREITGQEVAFLWEGASIPILAWLSEASGAEPLLVGFGHEDDRIHAPNESFSIDQFRRGFLYAGLVLSRLTR